MNHIPLTDQLAAAKRQVDFLRRSAPGWVAQGKWTQEKASREVATMEAVVETVQRAINLEALTREFVGRETQQVQIL